METNVEIGGKYSNFCIDFGATVNSRPKCMQIISFDILYKFLSREFPPIFAITVGMKFDLILPKILPVPASFSLILKADAPTKPLGPVDIQKTRDLESTGRRVFAT